jgi:hypothetical protein
LASLLEVYKFSLKLFHMNAVGIIGKQFNQSKNLTRIQRIFKGIFVGRTSPGLAVQGK